MAETVDMPDDKEKSRRAYKNRRSNKFADS